MSMLHQTLGNRVLVHTLALVTTITRTIQRTNLQNPSNQFVEKDWKRNKTKRYENTTGKDTVKRIPFADRVVINFDIVASDTYISRIPSHESLRVSFFSFATS